MRIRLIISVSFMLVLLYACIRDEVLLPPVLDQPESTIISRKLVTLTGKHFDPKTVQLMINDTAVYVSSSMPNELKFTAPAVEYQKQITIYVKTQYGSSAVYEVTLLPPAAALTSAVPPQAGVNERIRINGKRLLSVESVRFTSADNDAYYDAIPDVKTDQYIELVVPSNVPLGAAGITIASQDDETDPLTFTVIPGPGKIMLDPAKGAAGRIVRIRGEYLEYLEYVLFGADTAEILSATNEAIEVRVPDETTSDYVYVKTNGGKVKSDLRFEVIEAPRIISLDVYKAKVNSEVNIAGEFLEDAFEIKFVNVPTTIISQTATTLKTRVPERARSGKILITGPGGTRESSFEFVVADAPVITGFSPQAGVQGTKITVSGLNLANVDGVTLGLTQLNIIAGTRTDNLLEAEVTVGASTNTIVVSGVGGSTETTDVFTITGGVEVTSVSPASGTFNTIVTITGKNFPLNATVKFFPNVEAIPTSITSSEIVCQVPSGARTGKIAVNSALSKDPFSVVAKPVITSITPMRGAIGKEVVIKGAYLTGSNIAFFNNKAATILPGATDSIVTVQVPTGSATGPITADSNGGVAKSGGDFEIISAPTITLIHPTTGLPGDVVKIKGTNLHHHPIVQFAGPATAKVTSVGTDELLVEVPIGAARVGKITVKTDAVSTAVVSSQDFTIMGKPDINEISPASGTINEKVQIRGVNLENLEAVYFDGEQGTILPTPTPTSSEVYVRVPETLNATNTRAINVYLKTNADVSGNISFLLLGTPVITKISPNNNPHGWAFLIEGRNLGSVRKLSVGGLVPEKGIQGIEKKAFNYITTRVPQSAPVGNGQALLLYHTQDDFKPISREYTVLAQAPPGVFPPATIILPPPLPSNYYQTDLSDYWIDPNFVHSYTGEALSCYQFRGTFVGESEGEFCAMAKFTAYKSNGSWFYENLQPSGVGKFNKGTVDIEFFANGTQEALHLIGRVVDQSADSILLVDQVTGRQTILVPGKMNGCQAAYVTPGVCPD